MKSSVIYVFGWMASILDIKLKKKFDVSLDTMKLSYSHLSYLEIYMCLLIIFGISTVNC